MKANLPEKERIFKTVARKQNIWKSIENKDSKVFLHIRPPYMQTGDFIFGHTLNKILKDIITK